MPSEPRTREPQRMEWIRPLAQPYLRGYRARLQRAGSLRGYWFLHPEWSRGIHSVGFETGQSSYDASSEAAEAAGFFVGYLIDSQDFEFLGPHPPECLIFAFAGPLGGVSHARLVRQSGSLVRKTFDYIRWLTHRPPRFVFHEGESAAMARHVPIRDWPARRRQHFSRIFFVETLAWLVRSGLVRRLLAESPSLGSARRTEAPRPPKRVALAQAGNGTATK